MRNAVSHVGCPPREQLEDYLLGTLGESVAERVMEHLETCAECDRTIERLEDVSDSVVAGLRQPLAGDDYCNEPAYQRLIGALEELKLAEIDPTVGTPTAIEIAPRVIDQLDEYRLLEKLGQGGMGAVYRALHTKLDRVVALKVLSHERLSHSDAVSRFEREMKAVGKLNHPNIVHAYDAGEDDDTHYLVMEFVRGIDLRRLVKEMGPLAIPEACEIIRQAASGLDHANRHGMVHRDIKPSNLMLTHTGQVKILDLGLALLQDQPVEDSELTSEGQLMGTLEYMAPEQGDNSHVVDIRADIYSLGATLYKLLTGHAPFSGKKYASPIRKMRALVQEPVPPIRERRTDIPEGLANVVHRMLAKSPENRFSRPRDMAELLVAHAAGADLVGLLRRRSSVQPSPQVTAKAETHITSETSAPVKPATQLDVRPSANTRSVVSSTPGLIFLWTILFFVTAVSTMAIVSARQIRDRVIQWVDAVAVETIGDEKTVVDVERGPAEHRYAGDANAVDDQTDATATGAEDGRAPLEDALSLQESVVIRRRAESHFDSLLNGGLPTADSPSVERIEPDDARKRAAWMAWSPHAENESLPRSVWKKAVEHDVTELRLSEQNDLLTATTPDAPWYAWDLPSGMEVRPNAPLPAGIVTARISPLGDFVVGRGLNSALVMLHRSSVGTFDVVADPFYGEAAVNSFDVSLPGVLALGCGDGVLRTMLPDGSPPRQLADVSSLIQSVRWSGGGESLVALCAAPGAGSTSTFLLYDASQDKVVRLKANEPFHIGLFDLSSDGRWLATLNQSAKKIVVWNISGKIANTFRVRGGQATAIRFLPNSSAVVYGSPGGRMYLADALAGTDILQLPGHRADITELIVSRDGSCLVSRDAQHQVGIWNLAASSPTLTVMGQAERLTAMTLSHDGMLLAAAGSDDPDGSLVRIGLWRLTTDDALWNTQQWTQ